MIINHPDGNEYFTIELIRPGIYHLGRYIDGENVDEMELSAEGVCDWITHIFMEEM